MNHILLKFYLLINRNVCLLGTECDRAVIIVASYIWAGLGSTDHQGCCPDDARTLSVAPGGATYLILILLKYTATLQ